MEDNKQETIIAFSRKIVQKWFKERNSSTPVNENEAHLWIACAIDSYMNTVASDFKKKKLKQQSCTCQDYIGGMPVKEPDCPLHGGDY